jgi:hypothetical protein
MCFDLSQIKGIIDIILTLVLTVATVFLAVYTWQLVKETRIARKAQVQPYISIYLKEAETDVTLLFIIIENIGQGTAHDLKFKIQRDISDYGNEAHKIGQRGLFAEGMKFCPAGYAKKYFLIEMTKNSEAKMMEELIITATYKNIFQEIFHETFHIRLKEQSESSSISPADTYIGRIAQSLQEIEKNILKDKP